MLTVPDLMTRYSVPRHKIADWYARRILPDGVTVGGEIRFREDDIELFEGYLTARLDFRETYGRDPDGPDGPAPPVYSTGCKAFDPRAAVARMEERVRQSRSRTLASGSRPIRAESPVEFPDTIKEPHTAD